MIKGLLLTHSMIEDKTASDKWSIQAMLTPGLTLIIGAKIIDIPHFALSQAEETLSQGVRDNNSLHGLYF